MVNRLKVELDKNLLYISPVEIQLAYKLFLGSEKDIMDTVYLYELFQNNTQRDNIEYWANILRFKINWIISGEEMKESEKKFDENREQILKELEDEKERNFKQKIEFVRLYAEWIKKTPNKE
ncbi:MAG TPA: hypothetical protein PKH80_09360, partial [Methanofastidiosum sp.]|nr:hypothetical protein [Methanofastidiosum sp.]